MKAETPKRDWLVLITTCLALGSICMALIVCLFIGFGLFTTVGRIALYIAYTFNIASMLVLRLRLAQLKKAGAPAPSKKMRNFQNIFLWLWHVGAVCLLLYLVLLLFGASSRKFWVRACCIAGTCVQPVGWLGFAAALQRRRQAFLTVRKNKKNG